VLDGGLEALADGRRLPKLAPKPAEQTHSRGVHHFDRNVQC
jgi:hypothetical protein